MAEKILPENQQPFTRILLLALDLGQYDMERSLEELTALVGAAKGRKVYTYFHSDNV